MNCLFSYYTGYEEKITIINEILHNFDDDDDDIRGVKKNQYDVIRAKQHHWQQ